MGLPRSRAASASRLIHRIRWSTELKIPGGKAARADCPCVCLPGLRSNGRDPTPECECQGSSVHFPRCQSPITLSRAASRAASRSAFDAWASGFSQYRRLNTHDQRINLHRHRYQRRLDPNSAQPPSGQTRALQCTTIYSLANCPGKPACELLSFGHCRAPSH